MSAPGNDGGPAFPTEIGPNIGGGFQCGNERWHCPGITVRDYFAGKALQGLAANPGITGVELRKAVTSAGVEHAQDWYAVTAYAMADAMLRERDR